MQKRYTKTFRQYVMARWRNGEKASDLEREHCLSPGLINKWDWHEKNSVPTIRSERERFKLLEHENMLIKQENQTLWDLIRIMVKKGS